MKKLLNNPERITYGRLREVCARHGTEVHAKVRLADVLPIDGSGLPQVLYEFALQAHYDFVVSGADQVPLFAVEFDGPQHAESPQAARDAKKNALSNRLGLPLLRIQAEDLCRDESQFDRLTELIEQWFADKARSTVGDDRMESNSTCPLCGAAMVKKPGKYGRFLSCTRYPVCQGARDLPDSHKGSKVGKWRAVLIVGSIASALVGVALVLFAFFGEVFPQGGIERQPQDREDELAGLKARSRKEFPEKWDYLDKLDPPDYPKCTDCGKPTEVRINSRTAEPFFGCTDFPTCRRTRDIVVPQHREVP